MITLYIAAQEENYVSLKIRNYVSSVYGMEIIRCCVPNWKVEIYEEKIFEPCIVAASDACNADRRSRTDIRSREQQLIGKAEDGKSRRRYCEQACL